MNTIPSNVLATFLRDSNNIEHHRLIREVIGIDNDFDRVLATSLNDESPVKTVLSEDGEKQLKTRLFTEHDESTLCPIFHISFEIGDNIKELPCGHIFTPDAIDQWLKEEKAECPVCRFKLHSKEISQDTPGIQQFASDVNELSHSRAELARNLRRLTFPTIESHPFGPESHRIANVIHEDDNNTDIQRALALTVNGTSLINNIISNHAGNDNISYMSNFIYNNNTNLSTNANSHAQFYDSEGSYQNNPFLPVTQGVSEVVLEQDVYDPSASQDNSNTTDNLNNRTV
jgi:hypothetical protein